MHKTFSRAMLVMLLIWTASAKAGPTAEQTCQAGKNFAAGKYTACILRAERIHVLTADPARYASSLTTCEEKLASSWSKLEAAAVAAGASCPATSDLLPVTAFADACVQSLAVALGGGTLGLDPVTCASDLATCGTELEYWSTTAFSHVLKTGQTTCYGQTGSPISCSGTGQDGDVQKGVPRQFFVSGVGTITDYRTGLMWEKLSYDGSIHDQFNAYTWDEAFATKIATLNSTAFAGFTDWRLPNVAELQTLVNFGGVTPATFPVFDNACVPGCTVETCSCLRMVGYRSSTTYLDFKDYAWTVSYDVGDTNPDAKSVSLGLRAVRGGYNFL